MRTMNISPPPQEIDPCIRETIGKESLLRNKIQVARLGQAESMNANEVSLVTEPLQE
jgi:hypothetical protein